MSGLDALPELPRQWDDQDTDRDTADELTALRAEFDQTFAIAPAEHTQAARDYVLVTAGGRGYALPADELAGVEDGCPVIPVASALPALAGIAGLRGAVVPVFDLAALLGAGAGAPDDAAAEDGARLRFALAWVAAERKGSQRAQPRERTSGRFGQEAQQVGLAFQTLDRFLRAADSMLFAPVTPTEPRTLADGERLYALVDVAALIERLTGPNVSGTMQDQDRHAEGQQR